MTNSWILKELKVEGSRFYMVEERRLVRDIPDTAFDVSGNAVKIGENLHTIETEWRSTEIDWETYHQLMEVMTR